MSAQAPDEDFMPNARTLIEDPDAFAVDADPSSFARQVEAHLTGKTPLGHPTRDPASPDALLRRLLKRSPPCAPFEALMDRTTALLVDDMWRRDDDGPAQALNRIVKDLIKRGLGGEAVARTQNHLEQLVDDALTGREGAAEEVDRRYHQQWWVTASRLPRPSFERVWRAATTFAPVLSDLAEAAAPQPQEDPFGMRPGGKMMRIHKTFKSSTRSEVVVSVGRASVGKRLDLNGPIVPGLLQPSDTDDDAVITAR